MSAYTNISTALHVLAWPFEPDEVETTIVNHYYSKRYDKHLTIPMWFKCDGATWAPNIGRSWLFHDWMFHCGRWDDGTPILWRQANRVMQDIMQEEDQPRLVRYVYRRGITSHWSLDAWKEARSRSCVESGHKVCQYEG